MSRRRTLAVVATAGTVLALVGVATASAARPHGLSAVPIVGRVHAATPRLVNVRSLPHTTRGLRAHVQPALGRDGRPAGSGLPSRPSTGSKPGARHVAATPRPLLDGNFNGIDLAHSDCGCQPPDVNATIGPTEILETVNLEFAVYTKAGALVSRQSLANFFGTADGLSDPRAVYDPTWNRWEVSLTDTSSPSLWLAYSQTGDPLGNWWIYHVGFPFAAGSIVDYPQVGMNDVSFFYTSNNFDPSGNYLNSTAFSVPKARVYNGFGWGAGLAGVNYNTTPSIVGGYPTDQVTNTFMLSPDDANNVMDVYQWSNTAEAPTLKFKGAIAYSWAAPSRRVNQPGTSQTLDPLDGRIDWAVSQVGGHLWFAHGVDVAGFPAINWGFVNPGNMTITVSTAFHSSSSDDFNPAIAAEINQSTGQVQEVLTWAYDDAPNGVATTDVYAIHPGNSVSHLSGSAITSTASITSEFRFGDYASVWPEYNANGSCPIGTYALVANQYFAPDGSWRTHLARVHPTC